MTKVRIPPTLRAEVGGVREVEAAGATMREVLDDLAARFPGSARRCSTSGDIAPFVNVYLGQRGRAHARRASTRRSPTARP